MNAGNVRRRPIGTGAPMLHGEVSLTGPEWALIDGYNGALFELPDGTVRMLSIGRHTISQTGNVFTGVVLEMRLVQKLSADTLKAAKEELQHRQQKHTTAG